MKRGTASRVVIGGNTMLDLPKGLVFGTDVILGGIAGLTSDFNGLVLSNTLMLGKKISHISVITVIVRGQSPLNLPYAIADSLHYVKAFGGTELLPKTYLDTVTLSGGCEQRNLPAEYTQVNYVTNTAQTMINTGVKFDFSKNYEIELKASGVTGPWYILQARESSGSPISGISGSSTGNVIGVNFDGTYVAASQISRVFGHIYYVKGTINNGNMTLYVKDETAGTEETVTGTYTPRTGQSVDICLFGNTGGNYVAINSDVYFARIKENDTVVMDYVPARQGATAGFYDKVSGTFKTASNLVADGNAVPTPDTPMDIVSNNGVLKARHQSGLPLGYTLLDYIASSGTQYIDTSVYISTGYKVRVKAYATSVPTTIAFFGCTSAASSSDANKGIYRIFGSSINRCAWGNGGGSVVGNLTGNDSINTWYDMVCDNGVWTINDTLFATVPASSFTAEYSMWLFARNTGGTVGLPASCRISVCQIWDNNGQMIRNFVPAKNSSNVVGMYDLVSGQFFTNAGTGTFTAGTAVSDPVEIYTDGTVEQVTDSDGLTATAEMLLAVSDYKDTQEVIAGAVTRNVGIKVLDGTESWFEVTGYTGIYGLAVADGVLSSNTACVCSHYLGTTASNATMENDTIKAVHASVLATNKISIYIKDTDVGSLANFQTYLATQYQNGQPVICAYPLVTATTETVTGQFLSKSPVTQTAGSISNLDVTAVSSSHTTPTPQKPLQINCNNGVLKVSPNLFNGIVEQGGLGDGTGTETPGSVRIRTTAVSVKPNTKYNVSWATNSEMAVNIRNAHFYTASNTWISRINATTFTTPPDTAFVRFVFQHSDASAEITPSDISNVQLELGSTATQYRPYGQIYTDGTVETINIYGKNLFNVSANPLEQGGIASNDGQNTAISYYRRVRTNGYVPVKPSTTYTASVKDLQIYYLEYAEDTTYTNRHASGFDDNSVTFTTGANTYFIRLQFRKSDNSDITPSEVTNVQLERGSTATTYQPYYNGGTATAEMLLKVGDYQDVQSIIDGAVTRNVGVKVFDGTEPWVYQSGASTYISLDDAKANSIGVCTHLIGNNSAAAGTIRFTSVIRVYGIGSLWTDLAEFKQWLADQYNAGTPVIVIYPLATPTTETVTGQTLQVTDGDNVLEITQASMNGLELEASYDTGVVAIIQEVQDVNLNNNVTVTIE